MPGKVFSYSYASWWRQERGQVDEIRGPGRKPGASYTRGRVSLSPSRSLGVDCVRRHVHVRRFVWYRRRPWNTSCEYNGALEALQGATWAPPASLSWAHRRRYARGSALQPRRSRRCYNSSRCPFTSAYTQVSESHGQLTAAASPAGAHCRAHGRRCSA